MKKFFTRHNGLVSVLLSILLTFSFSHSKAITYQIGTGTTTNSYLPIYSCYTYNYSQQIYTVAELNAAGATGSQTITAIRFFYASGGTTTTTWNNWTVFIGNTAQTAFANTTNWIPSASMTQVFSGTFTPTAGTWVTLTLTTPFVWNGTSNLVVAVDENAASYSCTALWRSYTSASGNRGILYYSDPTNPSPAAPPTANYGPTATMPQIQFEMTAAAACSGTPAAGTSSISSASGCSGTSFTLSNAGASSGGGISYQWQSGPTAAGPWTNITGATGTTYSTTAASTTYYKLVTTCSNGGGSISSNVVSYTVAGTACNYTFRLTDSYGDGWNGATMQLRIGTTVIATFGSTFTTGTLLDIPQALCGGTTYNLYYAGSGSYPTEVGVQILDNTNAVIYSLGAGAGAVGTQLYSWTASCPAPPTISSFTPTTACGGSTVVTITGTNFTGSTAVTFGGTAAQSFTVVNATTITAIPALAGSSGNVVVTNPAGSATSAGFTHLTAPTLAVSSLPASALLCGGTGSVQLTASGSGISYTWNPGGLSGAVQTVSPASTTVYTVTSTNGTCNSTMTKMVIVAPLPVMTSLTASPASFCGQGNSALNVAPGFPASVCIPTVSSAGATGDYISNVNFNGGAINNTTGDEPTDYADYPALVASVSAGSTYNISVTTGPTYAQGKGVFIDYNKNGVFTDAGEFVWSAASAVGLASGSFTIPASASSGVVRMRVVCFYVTQPTSANSCSIAGFGEYEDYRLDISGGTGAQPIVGYTWSPATFLTTTTGTSTNANGVNTTTTYTVQATDAIGCTATSSVTVTANPIPTLSFATIPSPATVCAGNTVTLTASGNATSYTWTDGSNTPANGTAFTPVASSVYTVTATSAAGCTTTATVSVSVDPLPTLTVTATPSPATVCAGNTVTLTANGNASSYTWTDGSNTPTNGSPFTPAASSVYTATATSAAGCTLTATIAVTVNSLPVLSASATPVACNGGNGALTYSATGNGAISYTVNGSAQSSPYNTIAGTYTIAATDANGCSATTTLAVTEPTLLTISASATAALCMGYNGSLSYSTTGGTGAVTYTVNGIPSTSPSVLPAGTYTILATDANGCTVSTVSVISQPSALSLNLTATNALCYNGNGSLNFTASGGTGSINYTVNGTAQVSPFAAPASTYTVVATDANGCSLSSTTTITQPINSISVSVLATLNPTCASAGIVVVSGTGGTGALTYSINPAIGTQVVSGTFGGLTAQSYTVIATDANGCSSTTGTVLNSPALPSVVISSATPILCNGGNSTITVAGSGGTPSYTYSLNGGTFGVSPVFGSQPAGNYNITVMDANSCTGTTSLSLTQPSVLNVAASASPILCNGGNAVITASANGGTTGYQYQVNAGALQASGTFAGNTAGIYTVAAVDANGCTASTTLSITQPGLVSAVISGSSMVSCNGGSNGSATVVASGGTGAHTYLWSPSGGTSALATGLSAGSYTAQVTDANGCTATSSVVIAQPATLLLSASAGNAACNGANGNLLFSTTGGTAPVTYTVNNTATNSPFAGPAGTYTIVATDANNCSVSSVLTISQPTALSLSASAADALCNGANGSLTFSASGGTGSINYLVNGSSAISPSTQPAGTYTIMASDVNACTASSVQTISAPSAVNLSATATNALCNGANGSINLAASGGTGTIGFTMNGNLANAGANALGAGTYTVVATDANGCSASSVLTISQPLSVSIGSAITLQTGCFGTSNGIFQMVGTGGGTAPYSFSTNPVLSQPGSGTFTGATNGSVYTVTVSDANNCAMTTTVVLGNPQVIVTASSTSILCNGGTSDITALATGGTGTFTFSLNGGTAQASGLFAANLPGTYTVVALDGNSCSNSTTLSISQPAALTLSATATSPVCSGGNGTLDFLAGGGTAGYTYTVNGTAATSPYTTVPGTFTIVASDANGCSLSTVLTMTAPIPVTVTATSSAATICLGGSVTFTAVGNGLSYTWSDGSNTPTDGVAFTPAATGSSTYTVTATSGACSATATINLTVHGVGSFTAPVTLTAACPEAPGSSITIGSTGAAAPVSYSINPPYPTSPIPGIFNGLLGGASYTITLSDANGCTVSTTLNAPAAFANGELANAGVANVFSTPGNSCKGQNQPDGAAMSFYGADCHDLIAKVDDANGGNVLGNVNACVTVTPGVQTYNGQPYIRRSFVITPQNQGPATLTFYFTHEDITGYNANAGSYPQISIPGPLTNGSTISFQCSQVPQNLLPGAPGANTILHNVTATWNAAASRWEAVIPVTGFSGFYFHTGSLPLPVTISRFEGRKQAGSNLLEWSTGSEQNNAYFNLQHSTNGTDFSTIAKQESKAANGNSSSTLNYQFEHKQPQIGHNYYRLQQVDLDQQESLHAKVIDLMWGADGNSISIYPNPTRDVLNIDLYSARVENTVVKVLDMSGRVVKQIQARTEAGLNKLSISLGELAAGIYTVQVFENEHLSMTSKVKKAE